MAKEVRNFHRSGVRDGLSFPGFVVGIDLGGTKVAGSILSPESLILARERKDLPTDVGREALVDILAKLVKNLSGASDGRVDAVGIGVPGPIEEDGKVLPSVPNLPRVGRLPLCELLEDVIKCPVVLENDTNCFALGESVFGCGKGHQTVVGITLGTGLGVGIVIDGQIYKGSHWAAGEIWDLPLEDGHILEDYLSGRYVAWTARTKTAKEAAERARAGEKHALKAWHSFAEKLIWLLGILGRVVDPDLFVLGGSLSCAHDLFDAELQQVPLRWPVRVSNDSEEMAMRGAAAMAVSERV